LSQFLLCLHDIDDIFKVRGSEIKDRQHFPKVHTSGRGITDRRSAVEDHQGIINDGVKVHKKTRHNTNQIIKYSTEFEIMCRTEAAMLHKT